MAREREPFIEEALDLMYEKAEKDNAVPWNDAPGCGFVTEVRGFGECETEEYGKYGKEEELGE
jgi:hypothetical protein